MKTLGQLIDECVDSHVPRELALGFLRYEALSKLRPATFAELDRQHMAGVARFDDLVDDLITNEDK